MSIIKQKHVISGTLGLVLKILKNPWVTRFPSQIMATVGPPNNVTTLKLYILLLEDVVYFCFSESYSTMILECYLHNKR